MPEQNTQDKACSTILKYMKYNLVSLCDTPCRDDWPFDGQPDALTQLRQIYDELKCPADALKEET